MGMDTVTVAAEGTAPRRALTRWTCVTIATLFGAHTLFMWMFIAASGLEHAADSGSIHAGAGIDVLELAYRFAARWRHGMAGGSAVYMAGFFAAAGATWVWARGRSTWSLVLCGGSIALVATLTALGLGPAGAALVIEEFTRTTRLHGLNVEAGLRFGAVAAGLYTLTTWSTFIVAGQRALAVRSLRPFWVPALLTIGLAFARPVTVGDFVTLWVSRVMQADTVAIVSASLVPLFLILFVLQQLNSERVFSRRP